MLPTPRSGFAPSRSDPLYRGSSSEAVIGPLIQLPALSTFDISGAGNAQGGDNDYRPRSLPSLRSLNILPSAPLQHTTLRRPRQPTFSIGYEQEELSSSSWGSVRPSRSVRTITTADGIPREPQDGSFASTSSNNNWLLRGNMDFTHDGPRPSSSTSACSSITSMTSASSYSTNTASSEHAMGGSLGTRWSYTSRSGPGEQPSEGLVPSSLSSMNQEVSSSHPFSYPSTSDDLRQQLFPLRLDVRRTSPPSSDSMTPMATPSLAPGALDAGYPLFHTDTSRSITPLSLPALRSTSRSRCSTPEKDQRTEREEAAKILATVADAAAAAAARNPLNIASSSTSSSLPMPYTRDTLQPFDTAHTHAQSYPHKVEAYWQKYPMRHKQKESRRDDSQHAYHPYYPFHSLDHLTPPTSHTGRSPPQSYPSSLTTSNMELDIVTPFERRSEPRRASESKRSRHGAIAAGATSSSESERPFACPGCERTFTRRYDRNRHARKHTGEKPYVCLNPDCEEDFFRPDALQRHYRASAKCESFRYNHRSYSGE